MGVKQFYVGDKEIQRLFLGNKKIKELYYGSDLIFKGEITLKNSLSNILRINSNLDAGYSDYKRYLGSVSVTPGSTYFIRGWTRNYGTFTAGGTNKLYITYSGNEKTVASGGNNANAILWTAPDKVTSIGIYRHHTGTCPAGASTIASAGLQMVMDVSELLPELNGISTSPLAIWQFIGGTSSNFGIGGQYNSNDLIGSGSPIFYTAKGSNGKEFELP